MNSTIFNKLILRLNLIINSSVIGKQLAKPSGLLSKKIGLEMNKSNKNLYDIVFKNMKLKPNENILEIGFGNGFFFKNLFEQEESITIYGVELSPKMLEEAKKYNNQFIDRNKLKLKLLTGENLPFENDYFDKIIAINLIYFWKNPEYQIAEIERCLKKGGELHVGIRPYETLKSLPFTEKSFNAQTEQYWIELFKNKGFNLSHYSHTNEESITLNNKEHLMSNVSLVFKKIN